MALNLDVRWKLAGREPVEFEPELFALLQEIEASGSLLSSAKTLGVSYRYAWELMRKWSTLIGHPLAELQRGRGAKLTALGLPPSWRGWPLNSTWNSVQLFAATKPLRCVSTQVTGWRSVSFGIW